MEEWKRDLSRWSELNLSREREREREQRREIEPDREKEKDLRRHEKYYELRRNFKKENSASKNLLLLRNKSNVENVRNYPENIFYHGKEGRDTSMENGNRRSEDD